MEKQGKYITYPKVDKGKALTLIVGLAVGLALGFSLVTAYDKPLNLLFFGFGFLTNMVFASVMAAIEGV